MTSNPCANPTTALPTPDISSQFGGRKPVRWPTTFLDRMRARDAGRFVLRHRIWVLSVAHAAIFLGCYWLAFALRFDFDITEDYQRLIWASLPLVLTAKLIVFYSLGHFHGWWRYVTFSDLVALLKAVCVSLLLLSLFNHYILGGKLPRVVIFLDSLLSLLVLGCLRASWRLYREQLAFRWRDHRLTIMVGIDERSLVLAHQIQSHPELQFRIVGFVDKDDSRAGARMGGIPVLGSLNRLGELAQSIKATDVLVLADSLNGEQLRCLLDVCDAAQLTVKVIPAYWQHLNGQHTVPVRDVDIEDLLRRDPVHLDLERISQELRGQTVLVTGGGGSIGSEICRQLVSFQPKRLILVDHGENALFLIHHELSQLEPELEVIPYVSDILNESTMNAIFQRWRPEFVVHAAAYKHVGLMENNVAECVRNNVLGTQVIADLASAHHVRKFVLISTDKAVNPTSVMGASKQLAERYVHTLAQQSDTAFVVVRFGNVLGSNGSVVPLFKDQIRRGGPITITDERMTRYFMTIPEAAQLVLQAAAMGRGGEIFVLEMGEQLSITELAKDLIRLSGLPQDAIPIRYVGIRPGEKLHEELYSADEELLETSHPKVRAAYHRPHAAAVVYREIQRLRAELENGGSGLLGLLHTLVPEYRPNPGETTMVPSMSPAEPVSNFQVRCS